MFAAKSIIAGQMEKRLAELSKIEAAIEATNTEAWHAEPELAAARAALANAEGEAALGSVDASVTAARKTHRAAQERIETLAIRREGLEAKRTIAEDELLALQSEVDQARHEVVTAKREKWAIEYRRAAEALRNVLARGVTMLGVFGEDSLAYRLSAASAGDIDNLNANLLDVAGSNILDGRVVRFQSLTERDPIAAKEADSLQRELASFLEFDRLQGEIVKRRQRATTERQTVAV